MSGASNLGYSSISPFSNNNSYYKNVNIDNSVNPAMFSSKEIPKCSGGSKYIKKQIKNISKRYKMKGGSKHRRSLKKQIKNKYLSKKRTIKRNKRKQRGGTYSQYLSNIPMTPSYSVGGILKPSDSALANPVPIKLWSNGGQCMDKYNHFLKEGE